MNYKNKGHNKPYPIYCLIILLFISILGCRKLFITNPSTEAVTSDIQDQRSVEALLNGIYRTLRSQFSSRANSLGSSAIGLATDIMTGDMGSSVRNWFTLFYDYSDLTSVQSAWAEDAWRFCYAIISNANYVIHANNAASEQRAQAFSLRAYAYYNLINLFANWKKDSATKVIPISLTITLEPPPLASPKEIYDQIDKDLNEALSEFRKSRFVRENKSYIDSFVAHGLLARSYLFRGKLKQAKEEAMLALGKSGNLDGSDLMDTAAFKEGFNDMNNIEWMWGLPVNNTQLNGSASFVAHMDPTIASHARVRPMFMSVTLYDSMNATDIRKRVMVPRKSAKFSIKDFDFVPLKFRDIASNWKNAEEYIKKRTKSAAIAPTWLSAYPLMRKAEMYLIVAEGLVNGGTCSGNNCPVRSLRKKRMKESNANCNGQCNRDTVIKERRRELWGEGFALYDIKRLGRPVQRDSSHMEETIASINRKVFYVSAGSDSLTFYIPQTVLNTNAHYNGLQPIKK